MDRHERAYVRVEDHLMTGLAVTAWLLFGFACLSMWAGNPTAINAVIGIGTCLPWVTFLAIKMRPRKPSPTRPNG
jgi:hypothetical protein